MIITQTLLKPTRNDSLLTLAASQPLCAGVLAHTRPTQTGGGLDRATRPQCLPPTHEHLMKW